MIRPLLQHLQRILAPYHVAEKPVKKMGVHRDRGGVDFNPTNALQKTRFLKNKPFFMRILVTGGAGFIGSNFIRYFLEKNPDDTVVNLDRLTYAGNLENLSDLSDSPRYRFVHGDIADANTVDTLAAETQAVIHFAAESHVDRSIVDAEAFIRTNIYGTYVLLTAALRHQHTRFIHVSTDEVYGSAAHGAFDEASPLLPSSPYSASKAASDLLALSYYKTHGLPVIISRCSNNYGPYQFPEKLIPLIITHAFEDRPLPVYGDGLQIRDWLHVRDHCEAIGRLFDHGTPGEIYNISGQTEHTNLETIRLILKILGKPESLITFVKDRPAHDRRYAITSEKIKACCHWAPSYAFETGLAQTVQWYKEHEGWWHRIKTGAYRTMYEKIYGTAL